jgi:drug/metabolite transporter (DMT)-like permease
MKAERFFGSSAGMVLTAGIATFLWGSAFPLIKRGYGLLDISGRETGEQLVFAGYRFFLASAMIFLFMRAAGDRLRPARSAWVPILRVSLFQTFFQYLFFYVGLAFSTGVAASILAGTTSLFQMMFAHFMVDGERMTRRKWVGAVVGMAGVLLVYVRPGGIRLDVGIGEILVTLAMMAGAYGNLSARTASRKIGVFQLTAWQMLLGALGLLIPGVLLSGLTPFPFDGPSLLVLLSLAFISAAGFLLWNLVMKYNEVGKVSTFLFLIPVFGAGLSSSLLGETLRPALAAALLCVVAGITLANRDGARRCGRGPVAVKTEKE